MAKTARHITRKLIDDAKLRRLWPSHLTDAEIGRRMGHHPFALRRRAAKIGLPLRRQIWAEEARL